MKVRRIYCEDKPWTLGRTIFWSHFGWNAWQLACNEFLHMLQLQHAIQKPLRKPHEPPRHLGKKAWLPCSFSLERSIEPKERQLVLSVLLNLIPDSRLVLIATAFRRGNNFPCYYWLAVVFYSNPQQKSWWISFFFWGYYIYVPFNWVKLMPYLFLFGQCANFEGQSRDQKNTFALGEVCSVVNR